MFLNNIPSVDSYNYVIKKIDQYLQEEDLIQAAYSLAEANFHALAFTDVNKLDEVLAEIKDLENKISVQYQNKTGVSSYLGQKSYYLKLNKS